MVAEQRRPGWGSALTRRIGLSPAEQMSHPIAVRLLVRGDEGMPLQMIFVQQPLKSSPIFARGLGYLGDVALMFDQKLNEIGVFEALDSLGLGDVKSLWRAPIVRTRKLQVFRLEDRRRREDDRPLDDPFQLADIPRPGVG